MTSDRGSSRLRSDSLRAPSGTANPCTAPAIPAARCVLVGWGRTSPSGARLVRPASLEEAERIVGEPPQRGVIARGAGKSYGDAAQNAGGVALLLGPLASSAQLDAHAGTVRVGAAVTLAELLELSVPRGFTLPVLPGTAHVTVGGAVAADIHGKNHHRDSSIGAHILRLEVLTPSGIVEVERSTSKGRRVFDAVVGGMGLAGVILSAEIRLERIASGWMTTDTQKTVDLDDTMATLEALDTSRRYSVAWLDTSASGKRLGRGIVQGADHAEAEAVASSGRPVFPPITLGRRLGLVGFGLAPRGWPAEAEGIEIAPESYDPLGLVASLLEDLFSRWRLVRPATIAAFNTFWYRNAPKSRRGDLVPLGKFFFPLDAVGAWNRLYGKPGFLQYQFVVPYGSEGVIARALEELRSAKAYSPVSVLKRMGEPSGYPLSFPTPGWTLAVDVPVWVPGLRRVLDRLDEAVADAGGRVYLAKDSRMRPEVMARMYPRLEEWREARAELDERDAFESDLGRRLHMKG